MKRHIVVVIFCLTCFGITDLAFADATSPDVSPGKKGKKELSQWTREGELGTLPKRISDKLPLSDQANRGKWHADAQFTDEFEKQALDEQKWMPGPRSWKGREPAWFSPDNVNVVDGHLELTMRKQKAPKTLQSAGYHTYSSAIVYSTELVKYGYFEVRAKPMNSAGSSSFWFANSDGEWRTEIDVFELGGKAKGFEHRYNMNVHVFHSPDSREHWNAGGKWEAPWPWQQIFTFMAWSGTNGNWSTTSMEYQCVA